MGKRTDTFNLKQTYDRSKEKDKIKEADRLINDYDEQISNTFFSSAMALPPYMCVLGSDASPRFWPTTYSTIVMIAVQTGAWRGHLPEDSGAGE